MKRLKYYFMFLTLIALGIVGCKEDNTGIVNLSITDSPIDSENVTGVFITILDIQYNTSGNTFQSFPDFVGPKVFNLLDLTRGESAILGSLELNSGSYSQLRFILDAPTMGDGTPSNPGCYLVFADETTVPLFVPSGSQSGFKGVGSFNVPENGIVDVTADFDVRKSVVEAGVTGKYILKPTIRLIVNGQAGKIAGVVTNIPENTQIVILAYENGSYNNNEAIDPPIETPRFPNSISSDMVDLTSNYLIAYLAPKTYHLVVASSVNGEFVEVLGVVNNVVVESNKTTIVNIDLNLLTSPK
jgi:hypothetical protein